MWKSEVKVIMGNRVAGVQNEAPSTFLFCFLTSVS
jgi:hypothetical protein